MLRRNPRINRVDKVEDLIGPSLANELHGRLPRKSRQRLGAIPSMGHERGAKSWLDLVHDLYHLVQAALRLV